MATVKVKLRPSTIEGRAGVIFYQITHNRKTRHITTRLRVLPSNWNTDEGELTQNTPKHSLIQNRINSDIALLRRIIADLEAHRTSYSVDDIITRYQSPQCHIRVSDCVLPDFRRFYGSTHVSGTFIYKKRAKPK